MPKNRTAMQPSIPAPLKPAVVGKHVLTVALGGVGFICVLCLAAVWLLAPHWVSPKQLLTFGSKGTEPGQMNRPSYLAVDGQGNIYAADWGDGRINVFDAAGNYLRLIELGADKTILGMAVASDGTLYVSYGGIIHRLDSQGQETVLSYKDAKGDLVADISGIALNADGTLAAADNLGDVLRFGKDGAAQLVLGKAFDLPSFSSQNELDPSGPPILSYDVPANSADKNISVAVNGSGDIYAIGWTLGTVLKAATDGTSLSKFGSWASFPGGWQRGRFDFPDGLAVDKYGRIYVADSSGVQIFSSQEKYLYSIHLSDGADALCLDSQGNIYVVNTPYDHQAGQLTHKITKLAALKP